ncbi:MAG: polyketide synthase [Gammaproteobacteria bacterium]
MTDLVQFRNDGNEILILEFRDVPGHNALTAHSERQLFDALSAVRRHAEVKVVILTGLPDVFCSGASRESLDALLSGERAHLDLLLPRAVLEIPVPTIAAMEGAAIGGGFAFGLCADMVLMAEESRYGMNFVDYGLTPGMGTTKVLEHVLTPAIAHELMYTGEFRRGCEFRGSSGVNAILPRKLVMARALDLARRIADKPRPTLETLKAVLSISRRRLYEECRTLEALMFSVSAAKVDLSAVVATNFPG